MKLLDYYNLTIDKIKASDFKILKIKSIPTTISIHQESINYLLYEWNIEHKDPRINIFDYVIIPNNMTREFTHINFEQFYNFLLSIKVSKEHDKIDDFKNIPIIEFKIEQLDNDEFWNIDISKNISILKKRNK